ncbi:MAG: protein nirF [Gammaproteobacteria bacterium]|nr:protein nirF [Gammaproteobacteria bacterium]
MARLFFLLLLTSLAACASLRGTGDMGLVIERTTGSVQIVETTHGQMLGQVTGLGDLSHASVVYSRDGRYAYVFGRDGGLTKVDLLKGEISKRIIQSGNSIGGAISQDGHLIAVSNYTPGGVRIFDADSLQLLADIPAVYGNGDKRSKVVGLVDAPEQKFVFSLYDAGEIWLVDMTDVSAPKITRYENIGRLPYDGMITQDGRYYLAGLFGEDGLALLDLWHPERGVKRILAKYGKGDQKLPVYKMPHMEGWASTGDYLFVPAVGHHEVLVIDKRTWRQVKKIPVHGQPVFVMVRPDDRQIWVNFAHPLNDTVQVIDTESLRIIKTLTPGKAVLHMEFTPRGEQVWISVRDADRVDVYDTRSFQLIRSLPMAKPSGIFLSVRAAKIGM